MSAFRHLHGVGLSDIGRKRSNNEDSFGVFPDDGVFCVADGMGGGDDGEVASAAAVRAVETFVNSHRPPTGVSYSIGEFSDGICAAINDASAWICSRAKEKRLKGCGSTFVGVCFSASKPDEAIALHAGDSRLYRIRGRSIQQITTDHSAAELIGAKDDGELNPMFRGMILRAVGIQPSVEIERTPFNVRKGDRILVCSDGLSRMVPDKKVLSIVRESPSVERAAEALVAQANEAGGIDNVTVVLVDVGELPSPMPVVPMHKNTSGALMDEKSTALSATASCQTTCDTSDDTAVSFDVEGASEPSTLAPIGDTVSLTGITATFSSDKAKAEEPPAMPGKIEKKPLRIGRLAIAASFAVLAIIAIVVAVIAAGRRSDRRAEEEARLRAEAIRAEQARIMEESRRAEEERERLSRLEMERERERIAEERRQTEENLRKAVEAQRLAEEEAAKRAREAALREEAARLRVEEEKRLAEERRRKVEEEARLRAEQEARLRTEEEARLRAEEAARLKAEAEARIAAEEARRKAEEARRKAEAEQRIASAVAELDAFCVSDEFTVFTERVKVFFEPSQWKRISAIFAKAQGAADVSPEERREDAVAVVECVKKIVGDTLMGVAELQIEELQDVISGGRRTGQGSAVAKRNGLEEFLGKKATSFVTGPSDTAEAIEACIEMMRMIPKWFDL